MNCSRLLVGRAAEEQGAALDQIIKLADEFKEPDKQLQPIIAAIENAAARNQKLHPELCLNCCSPR